MTFRTRFAPSPTGPLHLGHAYSALLAHDMAMAEGGTFLLRIDDLDQGRSRPEWEAQIYDDLHWLGLSWPEPCRRESDCMADYDAALDQLWEMGLLYPCTCTRRDIAEAASAPQEGAPAQGPDGLVYPGTCRGKMVFERGFQDEYPRPSNVTLRLDMAQAVARASAFAHRIDGAQPRRDGGAWVASFLETGAGPDGKSGLIEFTSVEMEQNVGDVVVARKDMGAAYHLAVVVDDAKQDITHVVRGQDLFEATKIHVVLQILLGLRSPTYHHHRLIRDDTGKRLAKRDDARSIQHYRQHGNSAEDVRRIVGLPEISV